jgi:hypothetical protein
MRVKMVVFAPMPRAKDRIATAVKPGFLPRTRRVYRRFCQKVPMVVTSRFQGSSCTQQLKWGAVSRCTLRFVIGRRVADLKRSSASG